MKRLVSTLSLLAILVAAGCGPSIPRNHTVTLRLEETTDMNPIRMTVNVDGEDIFGPLGTLKPGETKRFVLNDSEGDRQSTGQHTILYTFDRFGPLGGVGHANIQLLADNAVVLEDDSRKVLTGFAPTYSFHYVIEDVEE
jgi:hypothetical protein